MNHAPDTNTKEPPSSITPSNESKKYLLILGLFLTSFVVLVIVGTHFYNNYLKEKKYQNAISLIKQQKWEDVGTALVFLLDEEYKETKTLYNYASAKECFQVGDFTMANHYMKDIPNTYSGPFKDDILQFKDECNQQYQVYEEQQRKKEQQEIEELTEEREPIKIIDKNGKQIWKIYISGGFFHFTGTYQGNGNFIVKLSDFNQDLVELLANEIGDYIVDKIVVVPYDGWYYLEIYGSDGSWEYRWQ